MQQELSGDCRDQVDLEEEVRSVGSKSCRKSCIQTGKAGSLALDLLRSAAPCLESDKRALHSSLRRLVLIPIVRLRLQPVQGLNNYAWQVGRPNKVYWRRLAGR